MSSDGEGAAPKIEPESKVRIAIEGLDQRLFFSLKRNAKMKRAMKMFADSVNLDVATLRFTLESQQISPSDTPAGVGLVDSDIVLVFRNADGGDQ